MYKAMKYRIRKRLLLALVTGFVLTVEAMPIIGATFSKPLASMIAQGKDAFLHNTFGGRGLTCNSCHTGGGLGPTVVPGSSIKGPGLSNAAAVFPRYKVHEGRVMTLADEIHGCIQASRVHLAVKPRPMTVTRCERWRPTLPRFRKAGK